MKKILILGTLLVLFVFYNCKNKETQPKELDTLEKTNDKVLQEIDTTVPVSHFEEVEKSESKVVSPTTTKTTTENSKTIPITVKVENSSKTITDPVVKKETEEVTNIPVETKNEPVINTQVEMKTKTEPIVIDIPKNDDSNVWKVPSKYVTMKNPIPAKQDASIGKLLFDKHCKSCHGKEGYGDGPKAADMKGDLSDFSTAEFQKQTDGELFYKTSFGRDDMPEFTKILPDDEDRWLIVNYMRTLAE